jgi:hypothetical protein
MVKKCDQQRPSWKELPQQLGRLHKVKLLTLAGGIVESVAGIRAVVAAFPRFVILMSVIIRLILIIHFEIVLPEVESIEVVHDYLT